MVEPCKAYSKPRSRTCCTLEFRARVGVENGELEGSKLEEVIGSEYELVFEAGLEKDEGSSDEGGVYKRLLYALEV